MGIKRCIVQISVNVNKGSLIPFLFQKKKRINAFNAEIGTSFSIKGGEEGLFQVAHFVV